MNYTTFKMILNKIRTDIQKMDTNFRKCISPEMRLVITLHFLANGSSLVALKTMFRFGLSTISNIINETMKEICLNFADRINTPRNQNEWENIARQFDEIWNMPHCVGALDGKHIIIQAVPNGSSLYFNYKGLYY